MRNRLLPIFVVMGLFLAACASAAVSKEAPAVVEQETAVAAEVSPTTGVVPSSEVSFSKDIWPVIEKYGLAAHGGKGGVFLENYKDLMKYVVSGKPEESQLYLELAGKGYPQMPRGNPLPSATIQLFYEWIKQGAKNN